MQNQCLNKRYGHFLYYTIIVYKFISGLTLYQVRDSGTHSKSRSLWVPLTTPSPQFRVWAKLPTAWYSANMLAMNAYQMLSSTLNSFP